MPKSTLPSSRGEEKQEGTMRAVPVPAPPCPTAGPGHFLQGSGSSQALRWLAQPLSEQEDACCRLEPCLDAPCPDRQRHFQTCLAAVSHPPQGGCCAKIAGEVGQVRPGDAEAVPAQSSLWDASTRIRDRSSSLAWDRDQPKPSRRKVQENMARRLLGSQSFQQAMLPTKGGPQHRGAERVMSVSPPSVE